MIFDSIPQTMVPGQYAEFKTGVGEKGLSALEYKCLIMGQALSTGSATANVLYPISKSDDASVLFGAGSDLHLAAKAYFENNTVNSLTAIAVQKDDPASDTGKSIGSIQITAAATAAGQLILYVGRERIVVNVASGDIVGTIATAIATEIAANHKDIAVKTSVATDTVTFKAKCIGKSGDDIPIAINLGDGELLPTGVAVTITPMASGATNPVLTTTLAALGDNWFQHIACPYNDATSLTAIETEMDRRFGPMAKIDGLVYISKNGSYSTCLSFGAGRNSKQVCAIGIYKYQAHPFEVTSMVMGQVAKSLAAGNGAEAIPYTDLQLVGLMAPKPADRFTYLESDSLLKNGISTIKVDAAGIVRIQRLITTYQKSASGAPDKSWLNINMRFIAMFIRYDWVNVLSIKYPRFKLAGDSTNIGAGQPVLTPKVAKAEALARYSLWEQAALVEDAEYFRKNLIAMRDIVDVDAMDWFLPCNFVNQFMVGKTQIGVIA